MSEKVLLETKFMDNLGEEKFNVKIVQHFNNIVLGDCVEVKILHPEESFTDTYTPKEFPDQFYADLDFRGWSFVLAEIKERL